MLRLAFWQVGKHRPPRTHHLALKRLHCHALHAAAAAGKAAAVAVFLAAAVPFAASAGALPAGCVALEQEQQRHQLHLVAQFASAAIAAEGTSDPGQRQQGDGTHK